MAAHLQPICKSTGVKSGQNPGLCDTRSQDMFLVTTEMLAQLGHRQTSDASALVAAPLVKLKKGRAERHHTISEVQWWKA